MIPYDLGRFQFAFIWQLKGSVFPKAFVFAVPCGIIAAILTEVFREWDIDLINETAKVGSSPPGYTGFSFVIGFLLVFRTSQAYARFWEGSTLVSQLRGQWLEAAQTLCAFSHFAVGERSEEERNDFLHLIVRLFSFLHSEALASIAIMEDEEFSVIDAKGLDTDSAEYLQFCTTKQISRVEVLHQWILQVVVGEKKNGVLQEVPAPLLTRAVQELADGMVMYTDCIKINDMQFPFPYAQMSIVLMLIHWLITPFVAASSSNHWSWAFVMAFTSVLCLWSLSFIAAELENPFGDDVNDLPTRDLQNRMNRSLLMLLQPGTRKVPKLNPLAPRTLQLLEGDSKHSVSLNRATALHRTKISSDLQSQLSNNPLSPSYPTSIAWGEDDPEGPSRDHHACIQIESSDLRFAEKVWSHKVAEPETDKVDDINLPPPRGAAAVEQLLQVQEIRKDLQEGSLEYTSRACSKGGLEPTSQLPGAPTLQSYSSTTEQTESTRSSPRRPPGIYSSAQTPGVESKRGMLEHPDRKMCSTPDPSQTSERGKAVKGVHALKRTLSIGRVMKDAFGHDKQSSYLHDRKEMLRRGQSGRYYSDDAYPSPSPPCDGRSQVLVAPSLGGSPKPL